MNNQALPGFGPIYQVFHDSPLSNSVLQNVNKTVYRRALAYTAFFTGSETEAMKEKHIQQTTWKISTLKKRKDHMKKKENRVMSFRFEDHVLSKINYLMEEDKKKMEKLGIKPRSRKELIEGIIENHYLHEITRSRDPDVVKRIENMVDETVSIRFKGIEDKIDELLFLAIKSDLGKRVFYRSPSVLPAPKSKRQALNIILNETSMWDLALEEYMRDKVAGNKTLVQQRQEEYGDEENDDEESNYEYSDKGDKKQEVDNYDYYDDSYSLDPYVEELIEAMMKEKENA